MTGKIIYIIGASGCGKDTILSDLRKNIQACDNIIVAHRYISRDWQSGNENHVALSNNEFFQRQRLGLFALHWQANGHQYAIGSELNHWLEQDMLVVVNGSREYLPTALTRYPNRLKPVLITVDEDILRQRLLLRGREKLTEINARLQRSKHVFASDTMQASLEKCHQIKNNHSVSHTVQTLQTYLQTL